ncbi:MAG: hypothetical protein FWD74_06445 [Actinomycetia bacterium]|nr:hypothetical protein [Actinomycetes bacterium]
MRPDDRPRRPVARRFNTLIAALASCGVIGRLVVVVAGSLRGKPVPGSLLLLAAGMPIGFVGQGWAIYVLNARQRRSGRPAAVLGSGVLLGDLTPKLKKLFVVSALCGAVVSGIGFATMPNGVPDGSSGTCQYQINNHGSETCVSKHSYDAAGVASQRSFAGVLMVFFSMHAAVAFGGVPHRPTGGTPNHPSEPAATLS